MVLIDRIVTTKTTKPAKAEKVSNSATPNPAPEKVAGEGTPANEKKAEEKPAKRGRKAKVE